MIDVLHGIVYNLVYNNKLTQLNYVLIGTIKLETQIVVGKAMNTILNMLLCGKYEENSHGSTLCAIPPTHRVSVIIINTIALPRMCNMEIVNV